MIGIERHVHGLFELTLQRLVDGSHLLATLASWTYWNSEFTVLGLALLWVYLRRNEAFIRFRNCDPARERLRAVGYVLLPTAPPRMFPDFGFDDTLASFGQLNHGSGLVEFAANPYAAMPSLHAADALIVGARALLGLPQPAREGALAALAGLGLVQRDGDRATTSGSTSSRRASLVARSIARPDRLPQPAASRRRTASRQRA